MADPVPRIKAFERRGPYRLKLWFNDGQAGEWDFSRLARDPKPAEEAFRDPAFFDRVFLEAGALTWPNGYDWCSHALHTAMTATGALSPETAT
jgi:hypothetical protein